MHPSTGFSSSESAVILYHSPSEVSPLLPKKELKKWRLFQVGGWILTFFVFLFMGYHACMHFVHCPPDPSTRDAIRRDWSRDEAQHATLRLEWERENQEHDEIEEDWKRATKRHETEVARRVREEHVRQQRVRWEWARETERHAREVDETLRREREEREREREEWKREVEERERREEEERQRRHMFWGHVEAHTCTTYATREYTAQLMNLPTAWRHPLDACKATALEIHGIPHLPKTCEEKGLGVMIGRWEINQQEPECTTFWDSYNDKGCTSPGSGKKYITHKLENVPEKSDWREFCATTPASFSHIEFPGAQECFSSIWGVYGQWEIDDSNC